MDRLGIKANLIPHDHPFIQSHQLLPQTDSILFDIPASPVVTDGADPGTFQQAQSKTPASSVKRDESRQPLRTLAKAMGQEAEFYRLYGQTIQLASGVEEESGRTRSLLGLTEREAELAL